MLLNTYSEYIVLSESYVLIDRYLCLLDSALSLDETAEEILDEDAVLGVSNPIVRETGRNSWTGTVTSIFVQDEEIEELSSKPDSQEVNQKRKLSTESNVSAKKIVLNRKPVIEEAKTEQAEKPEVDTKITETAQPERKIIKLSELGIKEVTSSLDRNDFSSFTLLV